MSVNDLIASAVGTSIAEVITLPICTLKTNYQTNLNHKNLIECAKHLYKVNGIQIFYRASFSAIGSQIVSMSTKYTFYNLIRDYRQTQ